MPKTSNIFASLRAISRLLAFTVMFLLLHRLLSDTSTTNDTPAPSELDSTENRLVNNLHDSLDSPVPSANNSASLHSPSGVPTGHTRIRIFSPPGDFTLISLNLATPLPPVHLEITLNPDASSILDFSGPTEDLRSYLLGVPYALSNPRHPLFNLMLLVDSTRIPHIIGRAGVNSHRIRQQLGHPRSFTVEDTILPGSTEQLVRIIGSPDLVLNIAIDQLYNTAADDDLFTPENSMTISKLNLHN